MKDTKTWNNILLSRKLTLVVGKQRAATAVWQQIESSSTLESPHVSMYDHIHATEIFLSI
jgi:hypothetical protein